MWFHFFLLCGTCPFAGKVFHLYYTRPETILQYGKNCKKIVQTLQKCVKNRKKTVKKTVFVVSEDKKEECTEYENDRLAIYTSVWGNYDKIMEPIIKGPNCDYYIITDQEIPNKSIWKKIEPKNQPEGFATWHPAIKNRYYKMHPHEIFKEYEYSIYIDGNVRPVTDLYPFLIHMKKHHKEFALFRHPIFDCLYDSAEHLKKIELVDSSVMDLQVEKYRLQEFPEKFGFFECGLILRKHHVMKCQRAMETWWNEYQNGVKRDQQSFTYALWKNGIDTSDVCILGDNIRENSRIKLNNHKRKQQKV